MKLQYALLLHHLNDQYATFHNPDDPDIPRYSMSSQDWVRMDRPVRITVTVEKL